MAKVKTMKVSGGEYAKVNSRMLEFRKENPKGKIETTPEYVTLDDTRYIQFRALIVKDKTDDGSAEATGHARLPDDNKQKTFEKCETIAVGRALAFLGYGADGEIASSEEMEEFLAAKQERLVEQIFEVTEKVGACDTEAALLKEWAALSGDLRAIEEIKTAFTNRKKQLNEKS